MPLEAENGAEEAFGDRRLGEMISMNAGSTAAELSTLLLEELGRWQSQSGTQQDDVTLIVIDIP